MAMTRKSIIAATAIALLAGGARGQGTPQCADLANAACTLPQGCPCIVPTDLDKAMAICRAHVSNATATYPPSTVFENGWKACYAVETKWNESTAAKAERVAREKEAGDYEFVKRIAEGK